MSTSVIKPHRSKRRILIWVGVGVVIFLLVVYLGIGALAASQLTLPVRNFNLEINPSNYNLGYEDVIIPARNDGVQIAAWYIPSDTNEQAIILVHGMNDSRTKGFGEKFVYFANDLHNAGFSVMMIDLRGHGQSEDSRFHFGEMEYQDVLGAVDWLETHGYQPGKIGVLGYSLGAASVIGATATEDDIGAIWIDSLYADINSVIAKNWVSVSGLPQIFYSSTKLMVRILYGYDIAASRPIDQIGEITPRPIYLAHCEKDNFIPITHMEKLISITEITQKWVISNCDQHTQNLSIVPENLNNHAIGYSLQPEEYTQKVIKFFTEYLE